MAIIINVVFDMDDVLNNLNDYVFNTLGLKRPSLFEINQCKEYSDAQKAAIIGMYKRADVFKALELVPGAREICKLEAIKERKNGEEVGVRVWINSVSLTQDIADVKRQQIEREIKGINMDRVILPVGRKEALEHTTYIVEDSMANLQNGYGWQTCKILIDKPHNQAKAYKTQDDHEKINRVKDLTQAIRFIQEDIVNNI